MKTTLNQKIDFYEYLKINEIVELNYAYSIEILTLKQILQLIIRVSTINPVIIPKNNKIYIYIENKYISTWIVVENLWGDYSFIDTIYENNSIQTYQVDLNDLKLLFIDIVNKRNGIKKFTKIAFTEKGFVYKHEDSNILLKTNMNLNIEVKTPFNFNMNKINFIDSSIKERRKIINLFYPELMDILTYFPISYNKYGIKYITDRLTIIGKLHVPILDEQILNIDFARNISKFHDYDELIFI